MDKVLVTLHGDEHRTRRTVESQLFRRNFFRHYENEVFPKLLAETLNQFLHVTETDLKELAIGSWCTCHWPLPVLTA